MHYMIDTRAFFTAFPWYPRSNQEQWNIFAKFAKRTTAFCRGGCGFLERALECEREGPMFPHPREVVPESSTLSSCIS